jgi:ABC-type proline/glycine betaine transport system permease subunit
VLFKEFATGEFLQTLPQAVFLLPAFVLYGIIVATLGSTAYHWGAFIKAKVLGRD